MTNPPGRDRANVSIHKIQKVVAFDSRAEAISLNPVELAVADQGFDVTPVDSRGGIVHSCEWVVLQGDVSPPSLAHVLGAWPSCLKLEAPGAVSPNPLGATMPSADAVTIQRPVLAAEPVQSISLSSVASFFFQTINIKDN